MANINIPDLFTSIATFLADMCDIIYQILFYQINIDINAWNVHFHCTPLTIFGVAGVTFFVVMLILKIAK